MRVLSIFSVALVTIICGCTKVSNEKSTDRLYESVIAQSYTYTNLLSTIQDSSVPLTKASDIDGWATFSELPINLQNHIILYLDGDSLLDWDEFQACRHIAEDDSLTENEKESLIEGLSAGLALKSFVKDSMQTKGGESEAECRTIYYKKVKNILLGVVGATVGGAIAGGSVAGAVGAFVAASVLALESIDNAGVEYVRCWA
ncbi:MAG: hypothetical protein IJ152_02750 [Bacteroidales bacterium]|nr:hypothetical protein [Bacteroidales bacterium]